jgi:hypothetical protein
MVQSLCGLELMVNGTVVMWTRADGEWYSRDVD